MYICPAVHPTGVGVIRINRLLNCKPKSSSHRREHGWTKEKEKRKRENRSEKRTSVIHTDSVVMKGIEAFMIYRAYGRRSFYFLMGRAVRKGVSICFVHMTSQWGRQHVFPSTGPGMELRTAFLLFPKTYTSCPGYHAFKA